MNSAVEQDEESMAGLIAGLNQARALLKASRIQEAETAAIALREECPGDQRPAVLLGTILLQRRKVGEALGLARAGRQEHPDSIEFRRLEARALLEAKDFARAAREAEASLGTFQRDADLMLYRCRALYELGRYPEADTLAADALRQHKNDTRFGLQLARARFQMGRYDSTLTLSLAAVEQDPNDHKMALLLCRSLYALGRYPEAAEAAARAMTERPQDRNFGLLRCRALLKAGQKGEALDQAAIMLERHSADPDFLEVQRKAAGDGSAQTDNGDLQEPAITEDAAELGDQASRAEAKSLSARFEQIRALTRSGQLEEAETTAAALLEAYPDDQRVPLLLGDILLRQQKTDAALKLAEDGIKTFPESLHYRHLEARALLRKEAFAQAERQTGAGLALFAMDRELSVYRCRALFGLQRYEEVDAVAGEAAEMHTNESRFDLLRCRALFELGLHEKVVGVARPALEKYPEEIPIATRLCRSLIRLGKPEDAERIAEQGLAQKPEEPAFALNKCRALIMLGQYQQAETIASAFLNKHPKDVAFQTILGQALMRMGRPQDFCRAVQPPELSSDELQSGLVNVYALCLSSAGEWQRIMDWLAPYSQAGNALPLSAEIALSSAYLYLNKRHLAEENFSRISSHWTAQSSAAFRDSLNRARAFSPDPLPNNKMPKTALDQLWSFADKEHWTRETWMERMHWGRGMQVLLRQWGMSQFKRTGDIMALVRTCNLGEIESALTRGESIMLTGAHIAAFPAIVFALAESRLPVILLSKFALSKSMLTSNFTIITPSPHPLSTLRSIRDALRKPSVLLVSGDIDNDLYSSDNGYIVNIFGTEVLVSRVPTWLAQQHQLKSYWVQALFKGDRIEITTEQLVTPKTKEAKMAFAARWWNAYLLRSVALLSGDPSNLYMEAGPVIRALRQVEAPATAAASRLEVLIPTSAVHA